MSNSRHRMTFAEKLRARNANKKKEDRNEKKIVEKKEERKEEKKKSMWDTGFSEDNWEFGNTKSIPDFNVISDKFDRKKGK